MRPACPIPSRAPPASSPSSTSSTTRPPSSSRRAPAYTSSKRPTPAPSTRPPTSPRVIPFFHSDKFYVIGGVTVSGLSRYPVFPIGGILWHINDKWDLRAYLPDPRLVYQASDTLEYYTGAELVGGAYKTDNRPITPDQALRRRPDLRRNSRRRRHHLEGQAASPSNSAPATPSRASSITAAPAKASTPIPRRTCG